MRIIVFSDMDGTLLDERTYSFEEALPALNKLKELHIPLILSSSKTSTEILLYQEKLGINEPFIAENGGGIFIPKGYFAHNIENSEHEKHHDILILGKKYKDLRDSFSVLKQSFGENIRGFGDMDTEEIMRLTGLSEAEAQLAPKREFGEPFIITVDDTSIRDNILKSIEGIGLRYTKGNRFYYLMGDNDKGKACNILKEIYKKEYNNDDVITIALGDSYNDLPLLQTADYPALIRKEKGYEDNIDIPNLIKTKEIGPKGWNTTILSLVKRLLSV